MLRLSFSYEKFLYYQREDECIVLQPLAVQSLPGKECKVRGKLFSADYLNNLGFSEEEIAYVSSQQLLRNPPAQRKKRSSVSSDPKSVSAGNKRKRVSIDTSFITDEIFRDNGGLDGEAWKFLEGPRKRRKSIRL